jgi:exodeoxyribonuclease VII large subunit
MDQIVRLALRDGRGRLRELLHSPARSRPEAMLENRYQYLDSQTRLLSLLSERQFDNFRKRVAMSLSQLGALSPLAILARGYSVSRICPVNRVMRSVTEAEAGDKLETILGDGSVFSIVEKCQKRDQT